jgi:hypothetical protein
MPSKRNPSPEDLTRQWAKRNGYHWTVENATAPEAIAAGATALVGLYRDYQCVNARECAPLAAERTALDMVERARQATPAMVLHLDAGHDTNGNPRRAYAGLDDRGAVLWAVDEGYLGREAVPAYARKAPIAELNVRPAERRRWLAIGRGKG